MRRKRLRGESGFMKGLIEEIPELSPVNIRPAVGSMAAGARPMISSRALGSPNEGQDGPVVPIAKGAPLDLSNLSVLAQSGTPFTTDDFRVSRMAPRGQAGRQASALSLIIRKLSCLPRVVIVSRLGNGRK
jgi:hypothetical protein